MMAIVACGFAAVALGAMGLAHALNIEDPLWFAAKRARLALFVLSAISIVAGCGALGFACFVAILGG